MKISKLFDWLKGEPVSAETRRRVYFERAGLERMKEEIENEARARDLELEDFPEKKEAR